MKGKSGEGQMFPLDPFRFSQASVATEDRQYCVPPGPRLRQQRASIYCPPVSEGGKGQGGHEIDDDD